MSSEEVEKIGMNGEQSEKKLEHQGVNGGRVKKGGQGSRL